MRCLRRHTNLGKIIPVILILFIFFMYSHRKRKEYTPKSEIHECIGSNVSTEFALEVCFQGVIPPEDELKKLTVEDLELLYHSYVGKVQVKCDDIVREENEGFDAWDICLEQPYNIWPPCLVYTLGKNTDLKFVQDVVEDYECEVHVYDASLEMKKEQLMEQIHVHPYGLDEMNVAAAGDLVKSFDQIIAENKHTESIIDLMKMESDGSDWNVFSTILKSNSLSNIKQLCFEFHIRWYSDYETNAIKFIQALQIFRLFYEHDFRISSTQGQSNFRYKSKYGKERYGCHHVCMINSKSNPKFFD